MDLRWAFVACASGLLPASAFARDPTDPPADVTVSGTAGIVSDYRFRGLSRSNRRPAAQSSVTIAHVSGVYATAYASTISDYVANGADVEIDLSAGYRRTLGGGTTIDAGLLYYYYPGSGGIASDYFEPYASVSHVLGPVTGTFRAAYAPRQNALSVGHAMSVGGGREDNLYVAGDLSAGVPGTPFSLAAHLGRNSGPSYLAVGDYTDWSLGASYVTRGLTFGLSYVDTDTRLITSRGRNAGGAGVVASIGLGF